MRSSFLINRRTCLKGIGASLALPLLESMGWADSGTGNPNKPPVRLGFMYMPHGVIMDQRRTGGLLGFPDVLLRSQQAPDLIGRAAAELESPVLRRAPR